MSVAAFLFCRFQPDLFANGEAAPGFLEHRLGRDLGWQPAASASLASAVERSDGQREAEQQHAANAQHP